MLKSMTGCGRSQAAKDGAKVTVEIKSVNHRFLEVVVRLPKRYSLLTDRVKGVVQEHLSRGRIEIWVGVDEEKDRGFSVKVDKELAMDYYNILKELAILAEIPAKIDLFELSKLEGVLVLQEEEANLDQVWDLISDPLEKALNELESMRRREGANLEHELRQRMEGILSQTDQIENRAPLVIEAYRSRLQQRINELAAGLTQIDPSRVAVETAIFADKSDITEEIVRLRSHIDQMSQCLVQETPVGRKLDFLVQEMHREVNTIGSKSCDVMISERVVELKTEIEKMREQVQNIE